MSHRPFTRLHLEAYWKSIINLVIDGLKRIITSLTVNFYMRAKMLYKSLLQCRAFGHQSSLFDSRPAFAIFRDGRKFWSMRCNKFFGTNITAHFCLEVALVAAISVLISIIVDLDVAGGQKKRPCTVSYPIVRIIWISKYWNLDWMWYTLKNCEEKYPSVRFTFPSLTLAMRSFLLLSSNWIIGR